ncbi:MAG: hypothetical protein N2248_06535 [candidate division WOR-3 bacterium]|uniref:PorV/PorQ family protein n=1 Tax=candidate division WOR-3 bacterium TaxID=2052148 RepID=A0A7C1NL52_UNCW3|nr:hypothetical protein [candidate division WOR-3 bacterium]
MKLRFWKVLFSLLAGGTGAFASVPVRNWWGEELSAEPSAIFLYPSKLTGYRGAAVFAGLGSSMLSEERTRLVYDQFENTIGEAAYADNISWSLHFGPFAGVYRWRGFGFGAGLTQVRDFSYQYLKEYLDDFYVKIGEDRVEQSGGIWTGALAVGYSPVSWLEIGAGGRYLYGQRRLELVHIRVPETSAVSLKSSIRGAGWQAGAGFVSRAGWRVDACYQSAIRSGSGDSDTIRKLPWCAGIAAELNVPGVLPARMLAEAKLSGWSEVDSGFRNVLSVRAGIEHRLLNRVRMSYGFGVDPLFSNSAVHRLLGRFGLGFDISRLRLDFNLQASREELDAGDFALPVEPADIRVYQDRIGLTLNFRYDI